APDRLSGYWSALWRSEPQILWSFVRCCRTTVDLFPGLVSGRRNARACRLGRQPSPSAPARNPLGDSHVTGQTGIRTGATQWSCPTPSRLTAPIPESVIRLSEPCNGRESMSRWPAPARFAGRSALLDIPAVGLD